MKFRVIAEADITYPDKKGKPVVRWKKGELIDDPDIASQFKDLNPKIVRVERDKSSDSPKKPSMAGKKKS